MNYESASCVTRTEKQLEANVLINGTIGLFKELNYTALEQTQSNNDCKIDFVRGIKGTNYYPRFHIALIVCNKNLQIEIESFHFDKTRHKPKVNFTRKTEEVKKIITELEKKEKSIARDTLISALKLELLFGNVRDLNKIKGTDQDVRWGNLLEVRKKERLKGPRRYKWKQKKETEKVREGQETY